MTELSDQIIKLIMQNGMDYSHHLVGLKLRNKMMALKKTTIEVFRTADKLFPYLFRKGLRQRPLKKSIKMD